MMMTWAKCQRVKAVCPFQNATYNSHFNCSQKNIVTLSYSSHNSTQATMLVMSIMFNTLSMQTFKILVLFCFFKWWMKSWPFLRHMKKDHFISCLRKFLSEFNVILKKINTINSLQMKFVFTCLKEKTYLLGGYFTVRHTYFHHYPHPFGKVTDGNQEQ